MTKPLQMPGFYKKTVAARLDALQSAGLLTETQRNQLSGSARSLSVQDADRMIENVIGTFGLPLALGLNFRVNDRDFVVPMVVEEPSVVAAVSSAAKLFRDAGGITVSNTESLLCGQIQLVDCDDPGVALQRLDSERDRLLEAANALLPNMTRRGGGVRSIDAKSVTSPAGIQMLIVDLAVDTRDAMGANLVNTLCEKMAPQVAGIAGARAHLKILSNLTDRSVFRAQISLEPGRLAWGGQSGAALRDGIVLANEFALADPHRAATHNKGIMNGIDPVAIATGNDWRALEAGAHAYAARDGQYRALTQWTASADGNLSGELEIPIKVGTVGGSLQANPRVGLCLALLNISSAAELASVMAAAGLAQNFAALRALASEGIQKGHMRLHARSVVASAGVADEHANTVLQELVSSGEIKVWKAQQLASDLQTAQQGNADAHDNWATASAKLVLLGEHSVVYNRSALALPLPLAVSARVRKHDGPLSYAIPGQGIASTPCDKTSAIGRAIAFIARSLGVDASNLAVEFRSTVPRGMGLGSSAALAVATIRAIDAHFDLGLSQDAINATAFETEKLAHGTPSGVDNTVAVYGRPILFKAGARGQFEDLKPETSMSFVVGIGDRPGSTASMVAKVATLRQRAPRLVDGVFEQLEQLTLQGADALRRGDRTELGMLMNMAQGQLNSLGVSTAMLEQMVELCRNAGALGAKLTGGGGGGSIVALANDNAQNICQALAGAGYQSLEVVLDAT